MIPKLNNFRSKKLTQAAKDQACQNCGAEDGTIVCAHSNLYEDGKGKGYHLGLFDDPAKAHEAYLDAKRRMHVGCTI